MFTHNSRMESAAAPSGCRSRVHQQIFGALPNGLQIGEHRPLISGDCDPKVCCAPLISLSPGPRTERAKRGGVHLGELLESLIGPSDRPRSVSGKHLARTCCSIETDPCSRWPRTFSRKHEAADGESNRTSHHPCGISCGQDASIARDNRFASWVRDCYPLVTSLPPSAFSESFLCGSSSSSSSSRMAPMLAEGVRQTTTQALARARACLRATCISFAWFYVDIVVLQGSYRRTAYPIVQKFLACSSCLACP